MNGTYSVDTDMNGTLHNGDASSGNGLLNSHTLSHYNDSIKLNEMNKSVENGDVNGYYCYMNRYTGSFINNHNPIDYTNKRDGISTSRYLRENNGLPDDVDIDYMLPSSALNQHVNMEYNNEHRNLHTNGNISTSNSSSVSKFTSPSITSTNDKRCSLFIPIHKKIKYSDLSKSQSISARRASDVMKSQIELLAEKTWHYFILEYVLKDKYTK